MLGTGLPGLGKLLSHIKSLGCLAVPEGGVFLLDCSRGEWRSGQPGAAPESRGRRELPGYLGRGRGRAVAAGPAAASFFAAKYDASWASQVALAVKKPLAGAGDEETQLWSLGREDALEEGTR